jgi:hypothetical protein
LCFSDPNQKEAVVARFLFVPALALIVSFGFMPSAGAVKTVKVKKTTTKKTVVVKKKKKKKKRPAVREAPARPRRPAGPTLVDRRLGTGIFGLRLGFSSAKQLCDCVNEPEFDRRSGGLIGITKDSAINHAVSYRLEGLLVTKGAEEEFDLRNADGERIGQDTREVQLTYLELGAQVLLRFTMNRAVSLYFGGGPYLAALMDTDVRVDGKKERGFNKDKYESGDYGLSLTGGALFGVNRHMGLLTSLQLTYSHGLADIYNHAKIQRGEVGADDDDTLHNRAFYISGGVHF